VCRPRRWHVEDCLTSTSDFSRHSDDVEVSLVGALINCFTTWRNVKNSLTQKCVHRHRTGWKVAGARYQYSVITFRVTHSRGEMCIGHGRLCVCLSCLSLAAFLHYCTDPDVTWCLLVVHYWICNRCTGFVADNIAGTRNVSECLYSLCA